MSANGITVSVRYYNIIRDAVEQGEEELTVPAGTTPERLVRLLCERYPRLRAIALRPDGALAPHLRVFVGGKLASRELLSAPLGDGDEVLLFPAVGGG